MAAHPQLTPLTAAGIELVVFDMAGTTVDEGGVVYVTLQNVLHSYGITFTEAEFNVFHGANKRDVIAHFVHLKEPEDHNREATVDRLFKQFVAAIEAAYFSPDSPVRPIPGVIAYMDRLRAAGIKVALNTGYPRQIAGHLIQRMGFADHIDGSLVSEEVGHGRPYPYMIHGLMKQLRIAKVQVVAKVGDTALDMEEGRNAGCQVVIGVLSGADDSATLFKHGASAVVRTAVDYPI